MRFGLIAYLRKPLIIVYFCRVQRNKVHKRCLESSSIFILCICEMQKLWQGHENAVSLEPSPHDDEKKNQHLVC